ncbi:MAG TPA: MFS transporter [Planctomycetota bacterium]|nr:MFS transporter [Planctomycetota bacterium]
MRKETVKALIWAAGVTAVLVALIFAGSRRLERFDAALVAYTFAALFAVFGVAFRYALWLQRPPTAMFWRRGWQVFLMPRHFVHNVALWFKRLIGEFAFNNFIWRRSPERWLAHVLIMWGCVMAGAITFPLVFGWIEFESLPGKLGFYQVYVFGFPTVSFDHDSWLAFFIFHGLVWSALLVVPGVMIAMRRRLRDEGAVATQLFSEDFLPLILLFAISITGLLLVVSYTWLKGYGYEFLAIVHAVTVIFTLLWLPFGKFFHIFQRPAQMGVAFYKDVAAREDAEKCRRCGHAFASKMHVKDLIQVEKELGYNYEISGQAGVQHYQQICPRCRRAMLALAQGRVKVGGDKIPLAMPRPMPGFANPGLGEGPLGNEDARNYHA